MKIILEPLVVLFRKFAHNSATAGGNAKRKREKKRFGLQALVRSLPGLFLMLRTSDVTSRVTSIHFMHLFAYTLEYDCLEG